MVHRVQKILLKQRKGHSGRWPTLRDNRGTVKTSDSMCFGNHLSHSLIWTWGDEGWAFVLLFEVLCLWKDPEDRGRVPIQSLIIHLGFHSSVSIKNPVNVKDCARCWGPSGGWCYSITVESTLRGKLSKQREKWRRNYKLRAMNKNLLEPTRRFRSPAQPWYSQKVSGRMRSLSWN